MHGAFHEKASLASLSGLLRLALSAYLQRAFLPAEIDAYTSKSCNCDEANYLLVSDFSGSDIYESAGNIISFPRTETCICFS
jgi:hypothetical protein